MTDTVNESASDATPEPGNVRFGEREAIFGDSPEGAMAALLDLEGDRLDEDALQRIAKRIQEARGEDD